MLAAQKIFKLGAENFPKKGPFIVVGNHTAAMEVVMISVDIHLPVDGNQEKLSFQPKNWKSATHL